MKTLEYLSKQVESMQKCLLDIKTELPKVTPENILSPLGTSGKIWLINKNDLANSWGVKDQLLKSGGVSGNLTLFVNELVIKYRTRPADLVNAIHLAATEGSFVSNYHKKTIVLTPNEITRLKLYIQENT